jgi:hypothetical protein
MGKERESGKEGKMHRRSFLKLAGLSSMGLGMGFPLKTKWANASQTKPKKLGTNWSTDPTTGNQYFVQNNLLTNWVDDGYLLARYDGWWWAYDVRGFDSEFHDWWIAEKSWYYDKLIAFFEGESESMEVPNGGHHHPMLSTYGSKWLNRGDSQFHLNTTPKGFTIIPKAENIDYVNSQIDAVYDDPNADIPVDVFKKRKELYAQKDLWDKTKFATLELYSGRPIDAEDPGNAGGIYGINETHTFQNLMENPMSTLSYMSLYNTDGTQSYFNGLEDETPTFEFRGFSWLIHEYNPNITEYEKKIHDYINQAHCRYHGGSCVISTNIFVISEEFNNTPGFDPYGRGKRVVPPYDYGISNGTATKRITNTKKKMTKAEKIELLKKLRITV